MRFVNLTPHKIVVVSEDCPNKVDSEEDIKPYIILEIGPSGKVARVKVIQATVNEIILVPSNKRIPIRKVEYGSIENLPDPKPDTLYIVSILVLQALKARGEKREDVLAPDTNPDSAVRDSSGRIVAVKGFITL